MNSGKGDTVKCYFCGGWLRKWEAGDDPWEAHAIWYPFCIHLVLAKSPKFAQQVDQGKECSNISQQVKDTFCLFRLHFEERS